MKLQSFLGLFLVFLLVLSSCDRRMYSYAYGSGSGSGSGGGKGNGAAFRTVSNPNFSNTSNTGYIHSGSQNSAAENLEKQGILTGAELNDLGKWEMWKDLDSTLLSAHRTRWQMQFTKRYSVIATTSAKCPVNNLVVKLISNGKVIWEARTDNRGMAQLWLTGDHKSATKIECYNGQKLIKTIDSPVQFENGLNMVTIEEEVKVENQIDIVFAVDATGSMDDEIEFLKDDLMKIVSETKSYFTDADLNLGSVFYQCHGSGNDYVTVESDLSPDIQKTIDFIKAKGATGGGEEVVDEALDKAINSLSWRENSRSKILFILLDEPPAATSKVVENMAKVYKEAAAKGIRIVPCITSNGGYDTDRSLEFLMRNGAVATNGTLLFLTDDSGIGGEHTIPFTDDYTVELFRDVLLKVIKNCSEKEACPGGIDSVISEVKDDNEIELVTELMDSLTDGGSDSTIAARLLPFTDFTSGEELIRNKPLTRMDTTALLTQFNEHVVELVLYPNPTMGKVKIRISEPVEYYEVTDQNGRILRHETGNDAREYEIDLSDFPSGTYIIRCKVRESVLSAKVEKV